MRSVELRKGSTEESPAITNLPRGTVVTLAGRQRNGFANIDVETNEGLVNGWVPRDALNRSAREAMGDDSDKGGDVVDGDDDPRERERERRRRYEDLDDDDPRTDARPRGRVKVPKDEGLLMRREESFYYGVQLGAGLGQLQTGLSEETTSGLGLNLGVHLGIPFTQAVAAQFELGYANVSGTYSNAAVSTINFGYFTTSATLLYYIDRFSMLAGAGYYMGIAKSEFPVGNPIQNPQDVSTMTIHLGAGMRFPISDVSSMTIEGRWTHGLAADIAALDLFSAIFSLQFRG